MKWSRPPNLNLTWRAPLLSLTLGGFFSTALPYMGFGLRADTPKNQARSADPVALRSPIRDPVPIWLGFWLMDSRESWASLSVTFKNTATTRNRQPPSCPWRQAAPQVRGNRQQNSGHRVLQLVALGCSHQRRNLAGNPLTGACCAFHSRNGTPLGKR